eukprot:comp30000_c0_seq1/m.63722 comp30000_c0_seq1/g.63722  ORF comp30000_c0_seq1/g.63722 comp30000_c0_seq1/m.63722 type:complete len:102 (+) comp30000_c0_seq1:1-306(+)
MKSKLHPNEYPFCFEIFGLDFLIDQSLKVYLIEMNTNPSLEKDSDVVRDIIPNMLNDAFNITIDPFFAFPHIDRNQSDSAYPLKNNKENGWIRVFDPKLDI